MMNVILVIYIYHYHYIYTKTISVYLNQKQEEWACCLLASTIKFSQYSSNRTNKRSIHGPWTHVYIHGYVRTQIHGYQKCKSRILKTLNSIKFNLFSLSQLPNYQIIAVIKLFLSPLIFTITTHLFTIISDITIVVLYALI